MIRRSLALSVCALAFVVAGCGNKEAETTKADTEGIWLDVGPLDYHIQGSRQLNPSQVPDDRYVAGLPASYKAPTGNETYFAIFLRIENKTDKSATSASDFEIEDTEGDVYTPIPLDSKTNAFAYTPQTLGSDEAMPRAGLLAGAGLGRRVDAAVQASPDELPEPAARAEDQVPRG